MQKYLASKVSRKPTKRWKRAKSSRRARACWACKSTARLISVQTTWMRRRDSRKEIFWTKLLIKMLSANFPIRFRRKMSIRDWWLRGSLIWTRICNLWRRATNSRVWRSRCNRWTHQMWEIFRIFRPLTSTVIRASCVRLCSRRHNYKSAIQIIMRLHIRSNL